MKIPIDEPENNEDRRLFVAFLMCMSYHLEFSVNCVRCLRLRGSLLVILMLLDRRYVFFSRYVGSSRNSELGVANIMIIKQSVIAIPFCSIFQRVMWT